MLGAGLTSDGRRLSCAAVLAVVVAMMLGAAPASAEVTPFEAESYSEDFAVSTAQAEETLELQQQGAGVVELLEDGLDDEYAGVWFDNESGEFVVPLAPGVDDAAVADQFAYLALSDDFRTVAVDSTWEELEAAQEQLDAVLFGEGGQGDLVQTFLDPRTNAVVIRVADVAGEADVSELEGLAASADVAVEVRQSDDERLGVEAMACKTTTPRHCGRPLRGGVALTPESGGLVAEGECSMGFKAWDPDTNDRYVLTAGHCAKKFSKWGAKDFDEGLEKPVGSVTAYSYPGGDWAMIKANGSYWDTSPWPSRVAHFGGDQLTPINAESWSYLGQYVCHSGNKTGTSCGNVSALDLTYVDEGSGGTVYNATEFGKVCSVAGDSGGPVFAGNTALGIYAAADIESTYPNCATTAVYMEITDVTDSLGIAVGPRVAPPPPPASWHLDASITGGSTDEAGISTTGSGTLNVFIRSIGQLLHKRWTNATGWSNWSIVPNSVGIASGPSAVSWGWGRTDVVARMSDDTIGHWYQMAPGGAWAYDNLGAKTAGKPAISSWGYNRLDVFAKGGTTSQLLHRWWGAGGWSGWELMGGYLASAPDAVSWGSNRIDVVAQATDDTVQHWYWPGTGWYYDNLGGTTKSAPGISSWGANRLDVFTRGPANTLKHLWWGGSGWNGWEDHGGNLISGPDAVSWGVNRIDVIGQAPDNSFVHWWWG